MNDKLLISDYFLLAIFISGYAIQIVSDDLLVKW